MKHCLLFLLTGWLLVGGRPGVATGQTVVRNSITSNTTWTKAGSPYQLNSGVGVSLGVTLTIEPGVTIQFNGGGLNIYGTVLAKGTAADSIRFTSTSTNVSGSIFFYEGSSASQWEYVSIRRVYYPFIIYDKTSPKLSRVKVRDCPLLPSTYVTGAANLSLLDVPGLDLSTFGTAQTAQLPLIGSPYSINSGLTIERGDVLTVTPGVTIQFNGGGLNIYGTVLAKGTAADSIRFTSVSTNVSGGIFFYEGSSASQWEHVSIKRVYYPFIIYDKTRPSLRRLRVRDCPLLPSTFVTGAANLSLLDVPSLELRDYGTDKTARLPQTGSPYRIDGSLTMERGDTLSITPGVTIQFNGGGLYNYGTLLAKGTAADSIRFTSVSTNVSGGVFFYEGSSASQLEYVSIKRVYYPFIIYDKTRPQLSRVKVRDCTLLPSTFVTGAANLSLLDVPGLELRDYGTDQTARLPQTGSPYRIDGTLTMNRGDTLTVAPGVAIQFSGGGLYIYGTLLAKGTAADSIRFTSVSTNVSGGVFFYEGSSASQWEYVSIKRVYYPFIIYDKTSPSLRRLRVRDCTLLPSTYVTGAANLSLLDVPGLDLSTFGTAQIAQLPLIGSPYSTDGLTIERGDVLTITPGVAIQFRGGSLSIYGTVLARGTSADSIRFTSVGTNVSGGIFFYEGSTDSQWEYVSIRRVYYPFIIYDKTRPQLSRLRVRDCPLLPSSYVTSATRLSLLDVPALDLRDYGTGKGVILPKTGSPYQVNGGLTVPKNDTLTISPGVEIRLNSTLYATGTLLARGTQTDSIRFTGVGNSTNGNLYFYEGSKASQLRYVSIRRLYNGIYAREPISISHLSIRESVYGLNLELAEDARMTASNISVSQSTYGVYARNGTLELTSSAIFNNSASGATVGTQSGLIVALTTWWGDASGPFHRTRNPTGKGNAVSDRVIFDPWLRFPLNQNVFAGIQPNRGGNLGTVSAVLLGGGFSEGMRMKLTRAGQPDLLVPDSLFRVMNANRIEVTLPIRGRAAGVHTIVLTRPDGTTAGARDAFDVVDGGEAKPYSEIVGFTAIRPSRWQTYALHYGNRGNIDAKGVPIWLMLGDTTTKVELLFSIAPPPTDFQFVSKDTSRRIDYADIPLDVVTDSLLGKKQWGRLIPLYMPLIPAGQTGVAYFRIRTELPNAVEVYTYASPPLFTNPFKESAAKCLYDLAWDATEADDILEDIVKALPVIGCAKYLVDDLFKPTYGDYKTPIKIDPKDNVAVLLGRTPEASEGPKNSYEWGSLIWTHVSGIASCIPTTALLKLGATATKIVVRRAATIVGRITQWIDRKGGKIDDMKERIDQGISCYEAFNEGTTVFKQTIRNVTSFDPNDKLGLAGSGADRYLSEARDFPYQIRFENLATATAPAQTVVVIDTLDRQVFNLRTIRLAQVTVGTSSFTPPTNAIQFTGYIDLRATRGLVAKVEAKADTSTGIIRWVFTSLDPKTLDLPDDPEAGFLPQNKKAPEGEGSVFFTVEVRPNLPNSTKISNRALIYFDTNKPIVTPNWINTIDREAPLSAVKSIPPSSGIPEYRVQWGGTDRQSGMKQYEIWYAVNAPAGYKLWTLTADSTGTFKGKTDSTYYFYSIGIDQAGNREAAPNRYDAMTSIVTATERAGVPQFSVYPNPTTGLVTVLLTGSNPEAATIQVTNTAGQLLNEQAFTPVSQIKTQFDLTGYPPGVYLFTLRRNGGQAVTQKVLLR